MTGTAMRVALYGNVANGLFQTARALREIAGIDAHLFLDARDGPTTRPESDDPSLADAYPDWIHLGRYVTPSSLAMPWASRLVRELREFDLLLISGFGPVFAQFTGRPWCFYTSGGDLTVTPFPLRFWRVGPSLKARLGLLAIGPWQRRGVRRATEIWTQPFPPFRTALGRLRIDARQIADVYLPIALDVNAFSRDDGPPSPQLAALRARTDFLVLHPSRLVLGDDPLLRETGEWKANDRLIRGFARFAAARPQLRPLLVMPDRSESPDVAPAKALIAELGLERSVCWLTPPDARGFKRSELKDLYAIADVVADDFGIGWFGAVVLEALAMRVPVVSYVDETIMSQLYPWHPICVARDPAEICAALERLADDPRERRRLGAGGRAWVREFHSHEALAGRFAAEVERVLRDAAGRH
jgi:glycosyltransferase involved in cell wall biosynthesis